MNYLLAYFLNSLWQIPLLALGTLGIARLLRSSGSLFLHRLWMVCFVLSILVPAVSLGWVIFAEEHAANTAAALALPTIPTAPILGGPWSAFHGTANHFHSYAKLLFSLALCLYFSSIAFGFLRMLLAVWRTRRIVRTADDLILSSSLAARVQGIADAMGIHSLPQFLVAEVKSPATVSWPHPLILLPKDFKAEYSEDDLAAISHEMAHIKRKDFAVSIFLELLGITAFYHPVLHWLKRRVNASREVVCDDMAATIAADRYKYASALLRLAKRFHTGVVSSGLSLGAFHTSTLEDRIQWLLSPQPHLSVRQVFGGSTLAFCTLAAISLLSARNLLTALSNQMAAEFLAENYASIRTTPPNAALPEEYKVLAIARGSKASILSFPSGAYRHQWMDAGHKPVVLVSTNQSEPSDAEKTRIEAMLSKDFGASASGAEVIASATPDSSSSAYMEKAHLIEGPDSYIHRWIGENGKPVEIASSNPRSPDALERHRIERQLLATNKNSQP
jgi:beta-lactamase regulating signal transducer with metallopeptidase domain